MKKRIWLMVLALFLCIWIGSTIHCSVLTFAYGEQFSQLELIGFSHMHPWEGSPDLRVMQYSDTKARVYYFTETGGELAEFRKENNVWVYKKIHASWTATGGTADDYFIWPYFRNWVI